MRTPFAAVFTPFEDASARINSSHEPMPDFVLSDLNRALGPVCICARLIAGRLQLGERRVTATFTSRSVTCLVTAEERPDAEQKGKAA